MVHQVLNRFLLAEVVARQVQQQNQFLQSMRISACMCRCSHYHSVRSTRRARKQERRMLSKILRVDHAGEVGADRIYAGQMFVLGRSKYGPVIQVIVNPFIVFYYLCFYLVHKRISALRNFPHHADHAEMVL